MFLGHGLDLEISGPVYLTQRVNVYIVTVLDLALNFHMLVGFGPECQAHH